MKTKPYKVDQLHFPEPEVCLFPANGLRAHHYRPLEPGPRAQAGVVVLPITGGDYGPSAMFAEALAKAGFTVLRLERRAEWLFTLGDGVGDAREPAHIARLGQQYLADIQTAIAWFRKRGGVDPARVGVLGISLGAMFARMAMAADPTLAAGVLLIGGANLPEILTTARDREVEQYRTALLARHGTSLDELAERAAREIEPLEALTRAGHPDPERLMLVTARFDAVITRQYGDQLWRELDRPRRHLIPTGHYSAVVWVPFIKRWARKWFNEKLLGV